MTVVTEHLGFVFLKVNLSKHYRAEWVKNSIYYLKKLSLPIKIMSFYNRVTLHTKHAFALKNQIFKVECIASKNG